MRLFIATVLACVPTALFAGGISSEPTGGRTTQPIGHYEFCLSHPMECGATADEAPLHLTKALLKKLIAVNSSVNSRIKAKTDQDNYGKDEVWTYPDNGFGDCEDYVIEKRAELWVDDIPRSDLLITVVKQPNGDGHAVLTVRTDKGDYILDNLEGKIKLWSKTPYQFLKRQSTKNAGQWVTIRKPGSEATASVN